MKQNNFYGNSIIRTKIIRPPIRDVVHRERLYKKLDDGLKKKLTVVSAPAGYGKTTLVSSWIEERQLEYRWISIDRFDATAKQFVNYLNEVLKPRDDTTQLDETTGIIDILNRMAEYPADIVLTLDDYHLSDTAEINDLMSMILDHLPVNFHIVLITRVDPRLRTSRLRGQGQLLELTETELQFDISEADQFLTQISKLKLQASEIKTLALSTEGWIAGLQILSASLRESKRPDRFIHELKSENHYLFEYLVEEVMNRLDHDTKDFLLRCSILDRLHPDLCRSVSGRADSQDILEFLEHHNLFLSPLDDEHCWFRLHNLFADLLYSKCMEKYGQEINDLYTTASAWFEAHGYYVEAIDCMYETGAMERVGDMMDLYSTKILMSGDLRSVMKWTTEMPKELYTRHSITMFFHSWIALNEGRSDSEIEELLDEIESRFPSSAACILRAYVAILQGRSKDALELADKAMEDISQPYSFVGGIAEFSSAMAKLNNNEIEEALEILADTVESSLAEGNSLIGVMSLNYQARILVHRGELRQGELLYSRALELATDEMGNRRWLAGGNLIGLGEVARLRGQHEKAIQYYQEGLLAAGESLDFQTINAHIGIAQILAFRGSLEAALDEMNRAEIVAKKMRVTLFDDRLVASYRTSLLLRYGEAEANLLHTPSQALIGALTSDSSYLELYVTFLEVLLQARRDLSAERFTESAALSRSIADVAFELGWPMQALEAKLILLRSYWNIDDAEHILRIIEPVLEFAGSRGIVQPFVDEGSEMAKILYKAKAMGIKHQHIAVLLAAFPMSEQATASAGEPPSKESASLSAREVQVLIFFSQGCTNKEVAAELCVSERTIKWHSSNIYSKLNVKNRTQAVATARLLGILP